MKMERGEKVKNTLIRLFVGLLLIVLIALVAFNIYLIVCAVNIGLGMAEELPAQTMYVCVSPDSDLNVRSAPNTHSNREGFLENGDMVQVYGIQNEWAAIDYGGNVFYCSAKYLVDHPTIEVRTYQIAAKGRVRVRSSPDGSLVKWIKPGKKVQVISWQTIDNVSWANIGDGYVDGTYLKPVD